jgi:hypothetical protein
MVIKKGHPFFWFFMFLVAATIPVSATAISNQGWIEVQSNADGASVYFDGIYQGLTENGRLVVTVYMAIPVHTITVEKTGYTSAIGTPDMPSAGETTRFYARLRPVTTQAPAISYGGLSFDTSPQGAAIYLNGYFRGTSPFSLEQIKPGSYTVEAVLKGYKTYTTMVRISPGMKTDVYCPLQSDALSPNYVFITSNPTNAFVYVDSVYKGLTPLTIRNIDIGDHRIELNTPGYEIWNTTINLPDGGVRTVSATMNATATGVSGTQITTAPLTKSPSSPEATKSGFEPIHLIIALGIIVLTSRTWMERE